MNMQWTATPQAAVPSLRKLLTATALALVVAVAILIAFVLPAEYGIDPLGTGRALHLTDLASATEQPRKPAAIAPPAAAAGTSEATPEVTSINPVLVPSSTGDAPAMKNTFIAQRRPFQFDSREYTLAPGEGMEIKYNMRKGAGLTYSWTASAPLSYEFHGEPDVKPAGKEGTDYFESYDLDDKKGKAESHGTFVAPSTGIHGWFWENKSDKPVNLKLVSAGFYDWIMQNRKDKHTALKPIDAYALPSHPKVPDEVLK
jgi:hypothetical protein